MSSLVKFPSRLRLVIVYCCGILMLVAACSKTSNNAQSDSPRLTPKVTMRDIAFHSSSLNRDMQYRVVLPAIIPANKRFPVVYLLHSGGGGFRDWSNDSDVAQFAERGLILIMPEGNSSYFVNAVDRPQDRYEDYIVKDLITDVENKFPVALGRENRVIVGVSMGGFGAVNLALRHPDLFAFSAGLSPALDVPSRPYSVKRIEQWQRFRAIFGPWQSQVQRENDPFVLIHSVDPAKTPYLFLTCGEQEGLLGPDRQFAALLAQRHFQYEFHTSHGDHDWNQWNSWVPTLFETLLRHTHKLD
jgi:putative tributyrin esterase